MGLTDIITHISHIQRSPNKAVLGTPGRMVDSLFPIIEAYTSPHVCLVCQECRENCPYTVLDLFIMLISDLTNPLPAVLY